MPNLTANWHQLPIVKVYQIKGKIKSICHNYKYNYNNSNTYIIF